MYWSGGVLLNYLLLFSLVCLFLQHFFFILLVTIFCGWMAEFEDKGNKISKEQQGQPLLHLHTLMPLTLIISLFLLHSFTCFHLFISISFCIAYIIYRLPEFEIKTIYQPKHTQFLNYCFCWLSDIGQGHIPSSMRLLYTHVDIFYTCMTFFL